MSEVDQQSGAMTEAPIAQNLPHTLTNNIVNNSSVNVSTSYENLLEKMIIQSFDGDTRRLSIDAWIDRYEMLAKRKNFNDNDMVIELGSYLAYEGLEWYMSVMRENEKISFPDLKSLLLQRFGVKSIDPMAECVDLRYDQRSGMNIFRTETQLRHESWVERVTNNLSHDPWSSSSNVSCFQHNSPGNHGRIFPYCQNDRKQR